MNAVAARRTPPDLMAIASLVAAVAIVSCSGGRDRAGGGDPARTSFVVAGKGPAVPEPGEPDARPADAGPQGPGHVAGDADPKDDGPSPPSAAAAGIPVENSEKGDPPPPSTAEEGARLLLEAIKADDPSIAAPFFFPGPAFDLVKNIPVPAKYHARLWQWFEEDVHAEHARYFGVGTFEFEALEMGKCSWVEPLEEGNKAPYWSCRRSRLLARSGEKTFDFGIRVIINWGSRWHVIHLGPIRT